MAQFPLALSIEPRLLPLAIANGLRMDSRVRIYLSSVILLPFNEDPVPRFCVSQNLPANGRTQRSGCSPERPRALPVGYIVCASMPSP